MLLKVVYVFLVAMLAAIMAPDQGNATILSFKEVWQQINQKSLSQKAAKLQTEALQSSQERFSKRWNPKLYLDTKLFQSNDPGSAFISLMEQRSIRPADFATSALNHPNERLVNRSTLGIALPLYEGGYGENQTQFFAASAAASEKMRWHSQVEQYAQIGETYASIAVTEQRLTQLKNIDNQIKLFLKGYRLGIKSNPLGYSGLLGAKSLQKRLQFLTSKYLAQQNAGFATLKEFGLISGPFTPQFDSVIGFTSKYLSTEKSSSTSFKVDASKQNAEALAVTADLEKSKFKPQVGAFAEAYSFGGDRRFDHGYTAGLYLNWLLYDPREYGSSQEAILRSRAEATNAEAAAEQEHANYLALSENLKSLRESVMLLSEADKILQEQIQVSANLYRSGSINVLQWVEILGRHVDLLSQQAELDLAYVKVACQLIPLTAFEISKATEN